MNSPSPISRRSFLSASALTAAAGIPLLAACSSGSSPAATGGSSTGKATRKLKITLQWVAQAQFAGVYVAKAKGYFDDEGIDLTIQPGGPDVNNLQLLIAGSTDLAWQSFGNVLAARDTGADLVNFGQVHERSGERLVYFSDRPELGDPKNWAGKKVSLWTGFSAPFSAACDKYGIPLKGVDVSVEGFDMTNFIKANVELADAMTYNEYAQALSGAKGRALSLVDFNELGTAVLEDCIVAKSDWLASNGDLATSFLKALIKGWVYARDHADEAVQIVLKNGTALPLKFQTWQMNEINKLMWPSPDGAFNVSQAMITQTEDILYTYKVIKNKAAADAVNLSYRDAAVAQLSGLDLTGASFKPLNLNPNTYFN